MAVGDYSKTTYVYDTTPAINPTNLNNIENKVDELDNYAGADRGILSKTITTANVTLSAAEALNDIFVLTGVLTGNRDLIIPNGIKKTYKVIMRCTGAYAVTIKTDTTGDDFILESVKTGATETYHSVTIFCDGANIYGDDYAYTGTFTPVLYGSSTAGTPAYSTQTGSYRIIGNACSVRIVIVITDLGSLAGSVRISGLPKTASSTCPGDIYVDNMSMDTGESSRILFSSSGYIGLYAETVSESTTMTEADLTNTTNIRIFGTYFF
jgi:hypothetical protein